MSSAVVLAPHGSRGHYQVMKLDEWMFKNDVSDEALAELIGRHRASVSRIRRGVLVPSAATMTRIATATEGQVTPNDLVGAWARQVVIP